MENKFVSTDISGPDVVFSFCSVEEISSQINPQLEGMLCAGPSSSFLAQNMCQETRGSGVRHRVPVWSCDLLLSKQSLLGHAHYMTTPSICIKIKRLLIKSRLHV